MTRILTVEDGQKCEKEDSEIFQSKGLYKLINLKINFLDHSDEMTLRTGRRRGRAHHQRSIIK